MLETPGKVLFTLLGTRIEPLAERYLWDQQFGFRASRGTNQAILSLRLMQQMASDVGGPLCSVYLDIRKAFDSLPRGLILQALEVIGVPSVLVDFYAQVHENVECKLDGRNSFVMKRGVRQGSREGPVLFNLAYQLILNQAFRRVSGLGVALRQTDFMDTVELGPSPAVGRVACLLYADDLVLLDESTDPLGRAVKALQAVGTRLGIEIAPSKSEVLWLSGRPRDPGPILLNGTEIPERNSVEYLGVLFEQSKPESEKSDVLYNVSKTLAALGKIRPYLRVPALSVRARSDRVNTEILPVLWNGCETWCLTKSKLHVSTSVD